MKDGLTAHKDQLRIDSFENIEDWMSAVQHMRIRNTPIRAMFRAIHHKIS